MAALRGATFFFAWIFAGDIAAAFTAFRAGFFFAGIFFIALGALTLAAMAGALLIGFFDLAFDFDFVVRFMLVSCVVCGDRSDV